MWLRGWGWVAVVAEMERSESHREGKERQGQENILSMWVHLNFVI